MTTDIQKNKQSLIYYYSHPQSFGSGELKIASVNKIPVKHLLNLILKEQIKDNLNYLLESSLYI